MRTVKFYTTLGKLIKVETDATVWGELKVLAQAEGINTTELKAMVNVNKTTLDHDEAELPEGEFTVFFTKINSKAGTNFSELSYREVRRKVKELVDYETGASEHFNQNVNYTNKSKERLIYLLEEWVNSNEVEEEETLVNVESNSIMFSVTLGDLLEKIKETLEYKLIDESDEKFIADIEDYMEESDLLEEFIIFKEEKEEIDPELLEAQREARELGIL